MTGGRAVILGPIGRNFAAGMSGGIAYIWDEDEHARQRINTSMVELEDLIDPHEINELKSLIAEHAQVTGSERAERILSTWDVQLRKFIKVIPYDYKRALARIAVEKAVVK
jgi:glutamate synthase domain-containing protein 3